MATLAFTIIFNVRYRLLRYAPTSILLIRAHRRRGLGWIALAAGLAAVFFYAAAICTTILSHGGPSELNALVLLFTWNGFKMLRIDPITLVLRGRVHVTRADETADTQDDDQAPVQPEVETVGVVR